MKHSMRLSNDYVIHKELTQQRILVFDLKWSLCEFLWCKKGQINSINLKFSMTGNDIKQITQK